MRFRTCFASSLWTKENQEKYKRKSDGNCWSLFGINQNHLIKERCMIITFEHELKSMRLVRTENSHVPHYKRVHTLTVYNQVIVRFFLFVFFLKPFYLFFTWILFGCYITLKVWKDPMGSDLYHNNKTKVLFDILCRRKVFDGNKHYIKIYVWIICTHINSSMFFKNYLI